MYDVIIYINGAPYAIGAPQRRIADSRDRSAYGRQAIARAQTHPQKSYLRVCNPLAPGVRIGTAEHLGGHDFGFVGVEGFDGALDVRFEDVGVVFDDRFRRFAVLDAVVEVVPDVGERVDFLDG